MGQRIRAYGRALVVPLLLTCAVLVFIAAAVLASRSTDDDPPPVDGNALVQAIQDLRIVQGDYLAARALAEDFLDTYLEPTQLRHRVEYEHALTHADAGESQTALGLLDGLVATYADADFVAPGFAGAPDFADPAIVIDDAQFDAGMLCVGLEDAAGAITRFEAVRAEYPTSNRHAEALWRLGGLYRQAGELEPALVRYTELVAQHADDARAPEAQLQVGRILRTWEQWNDAIAAYESVATLWPESAHAAAGGFYAALVHEDHGDPAEALQRYDALGSTYPDAAFAHEGTMRAGHMRIRARDYAAAQATFDSVVTRWPESRHAPVAIQFANRALIHAELEAREPEPGVFTATEVDHAAAIASRVQRALSDYGEAEVTPAILLDAINYRSRRAAQNRALPAETRSAILELSARLAQEAPESREAQRAKLDRALFVFRDEPAAAWGLIDEAMSWAEAHEDDSLLNDAGYTLGRLLGGSGQQAQARAAFEGLLARPQGRLFEGEVRIAIAVTHLLENEYAAAEAAVEALVADETYPTDVRASALFKRAHARRLLNRADEAIADLDEAIAMQPETRSAATAAHFRAVLQRQARP